MTPPGAAGYARDGESVLLRWSPRTLAARRRVESMIQALAHERRAAPVIEELRALRRLEEADALAMIEQAERDAQAAAAVGR